MKTRSWWSKAWMEIITHWETISDMRECNCFKIHWASFTISFKRMAKAKSWKEIQKMHMRKTMFVFSNSRRAAAWRLMEMEITSIWWMRTILSTIWPGQGIKVKECSRKQVNIPLRKYSSWSTSLLTSMLSSSIRSSPFSDRKSSISTKQAPQLFQRALWRLKIS